MLLIITSTGDELFRANNIDDWNDLEPKNKGFLMNFLPFWAAKTHFNSALKWLAIDQDKLHTKFSELNVNLPTP